MLVVGTACVVVMTAVSSIGASDAALSHCQRELDQCKIKAEEIAAKDSNVDQHYVELVERRWNVAKKALQMYCQSLLLAEFGPAFRPRIVEITLKLPGEKQQRTLQIELAPDADMPTTVLYFLRQVKAGVWTGAKFHRNAGHVLQASAKTQKVATLTEHSIPFQEYTPSLSHKPLTVGLAGRPGGPDWYINTVDNTQNHGPGSQNADARLLAEADPCFGRIISGMDAIEAMKKLPTNGDSFGMLRKTVRIVDAIIR